MTLKELLVTAGGIGIVVKLLVDVAKAVTSIKGRATQVLSILLGVLLGLLGGIYYLHTNDIPESIWLGLQAGAAAIGIDQMTKKDV